MILELSDHQERLRSQAEAFAASEVTPIAASIDDANAIPPELVRAAATAGFLDVEDGPAGGDRVAAACALAALAGGSAALALHVGGTGLVRAAFRRFGGSAVARRWDDRLAAGEEAAAILIADPAVVYERRERGIVRNFHATWVPNLHGAAVGLCVLAPDRASQPAIAWVHALDGEAELGRTRRRDSTGLRGAGWADAAASSIHLNDESVIGDDPDASDAGARWIRDQARVLAAAIAIGIGRAAISQAVIVTRAREDRGSQAVRFAIADASSEIDAAWLVTLKAASESGHADAGLASMAKFLATDAALHATDAGMRLAAPDSYARGSIAERLARDAQAIDAVFGTSYRARHDAASALGLMES